MVTKVKGSTLGDKGFKTVSDMDLSQSLKVGDFVTVQDYATGNNSGVLYFKIVAAATGVDDGGSFIDLSASGLQAKQIFGDTISVKQFGAVGDGVTNDTSAFLSTAEHIPASSKIRIKVTKGTYLLSTDVTPSGGRKVYWNFDQGATLVGPGILSGKEIKYYKNDGLDVRGEGHEDTYSPWTANNGYSLKVSGSQGTGGGLPFMSVVRNDLAADTVAFPTAGTFYGRVDNDGNQVFGLFARVDTYSTRGAPKNELNVFNESGVDATSTVDPDQSFGTSEQVPICLAVNAGGDTAGARDSAIGLYIGTEGGSTTGFKGGILVSPKGCIDYGIAVRGTNTRHARLIDTDSTAVAGPHLYLERDSASPSGGDILGNIIFTGKNNSASEIEYAKISTEIQDATAGSENGKLRFQFYNTTALETGILIDGGTGNNPVSLRVNGSLKQVTEGVVDSGGAGYRLLRVVN